MSATVDPPSRISEIDEDPTWVVPLPDDLALERVGEAIGAIGNGHAGIRASLEEDGPGSGPLFAVNGIYDGEPVPRLLEGPVWTGLAVRDGSRRGRRLDLRTGVLVRHDDDSGVRTIQLVSAARPHALALRAEGPVDRLDVADPFAAAPPTAERVRRGDVDLAWTAAPGGGGIAVGVRDRVEVVGARRVVERIGAWAAGPSGPPDLDEVVARLDELAEAGFDRLYAEHRAAWAERWASAEVAIDGAPDDELAARFALFHLLACAPEEGEAAVGPRGLTGHAYGGHVFWDADVYVLPALAAMRPAAARAMLEYRIRRLPAARAAAAALGLRGARFPWESATDGTDVTPRQLVGLDGVPVPVRTAEQEEHIVADVAWAADAYARWTGDATFLAGPGRSLVVETAEYWASRVRLDDDGRAHIEGVMGPDEYHEAVDDNAFTNVMARWNLRRGAALLEEEGDHDRAAAWRRLADRLVDGWDPERGRHEQFAGYWDLEPLRADRLGTRPFAAPLVLGRERVAGSQIIKQPDVVMLHHLVPEELPPGSLAADVAFYEPRTSHGSSLSPAIYAAVLARAGQPDRALAAWRLAARLDLDDLTGTTASGVHLATMGGVWQALVHGFLGMRPHPDHLSLDPCLPTAWRGLTVRLRFQGQLVAVRARHDAVTVECEQPLALRVAGGPTVTCAPPCQRFPVAPPAERSTR